MKCKKLIAVGVAAICGLLIAPSVMAAQQQGQSVAEAARKAHEKQQQAPKAKTVWTNDNIPTTPGDVNIMGPTESAPSTPSSTETQAAAASGAAPTENAKTSDDIEKVKKDLEDAKSQLASVKTDLDILQREHALDAAQYYGTPNYAADQKGQAKLDGEKAQIAAKQQDVNAAQQKVDDLEKKLKTLQEDKSPATKTQTPQA